MAHLQITRTPIGLLFEPTVASICKGRSARAHLGHPSPISRPTHPFPFSLLLVSCFSRRDYACNKFAKPLVNRRGSHLYGRAWRGQRPPGARPGDTDLCSVGSRLRKSGMLRSSATGTLGEQGFQSDCISFGAGGRGLDQAISLRMRPQSLDALTRAAISGSAGSAVQ